MELSRSADDSSMGRWMSIDALTNEERHNYLLYQYIMFNEEERDVVRRIFLNAVLTLEQKKALIHQFIRECARAKRENRRIPTYAEFARGRKVVM